MKQNWFNTLNESLESEGLVELWPMSSNIQYGQTVRHIVETGKLKGKRQTPELMFISVYRDERGLYERPVHYVTN
jgi:hypothetical protein